VKRDPAGLPGAAAAFACTKPRMAGKAWARPLDGPMAVIKSVK